MADIAKIRLNKVLKEFNISLDRAVDFLASKGHEIDARPTTKISDEVYGVLQEEFQTDKSKKVASKEVGEEKRKEKEALRLQLEQEQEERRLAREERAAASQERQLVGKVELTGPKTVGKIDLDAKKKPAPQKEEKPEEKEEVVEQAETPKTEEVVEPKVEEEKKVTEEEESPEEDRLKTNYKKLSGPTITDKIDLSQFKKTKKKKEEAKSTTSSGSDRKKRRKRIVTKTSSDSGRASGGRDFKKGGKRFATAK
ncbi:MAG: translation initiation factor IF-2, partial [Pricia sp.]|nr:translation initiation factor IF-2 [Pricia sp.]